MPRLLSTLFVTILAARNVHAFPRDMNGGSEGSRLFPRQNVPNGLPNSIGESNTGVIKSTTFDPKDQFVDVRPGTTHAFVAPGKGDIRGPCPGLNAAANHGFLPHNGLATTEQTIAGLGQAYNMGPDLAGALAVVAIALTGDYATARWSIGGAFPKGINSILLSNPGGISNSHNKYEGDSSVGRGDAYLHGGDASSLNIQNFDSLYNLAENYTLATLRDHALAGRKFSIANNPYAFFAPFSGLVSTAAHEFVVNLMSNHSTSQPSGYLNRDILKQFFAVTGADGAHKWNPGQERIPLNWYRRPSTNQYDLARNNTDNVISLATYPELATFGGNMGKTNTFTGVDVSDLSNGAFNAKSLLQGNNLGCFTFGFLEAVLPDQLAGLVGDVSPITSFVAKKLGPVYTALGCPANVKYNQGLFNKFPGYKYDPSKTNPGRRSEAPFST